MGASGSVDCSFIDCFKEMVEYVENGKNELALLKLEEVIPTIPRGIGNDIFFTDVALALEHTSIQRRIEVFADILDQGELNRKSVRVDMISEIGAAKIVAGVIRKFDIEEQWQIFRRLPERYGSSVYDVFGADKAKELSKREERDVLIELAGSQELHHKRKAARKLELAPFDNSPSGVDDRWAPNALEERLVPKTKYDPEAQKAIAELIAERKFWPDLLLNSDINVFYELLSKMLQEDLSYDDLKRILPLSLKSKPKLECKLKSGWDGLDVPPPRDEKELKKIRKLLRKGLLEGKHKIAWLWEDENRKSNGLVNTVVIPPEDHFVKPALAETLDVFKDKRLMAEFKFLTGRAGIADPVPVKRDFHMPEIDIAEILATEIMEDIEYTLVPIEPAEVLSSISRRNDALAAINGGFFVAQRSEFREGRSPIKSPLGLIIIDGKMVIPPTIRRATLLIDACGTPHIELVSMEDAEITMGPPGEEKIFVCDRLCQTQRADRIPFYLAPFGVSVFNPRARDVIVYTARFVNRVRGTNRTMSIRNRVEIGVLHNRIIFINKESGSIIPQNGFVISISLDSQQSELEDLRCWMKKLSVGRKVKLRLHTDCNLKCKNIREPILQGIAGGPLLVKDDYCLKSEDFCYPDAKLPCKYKEEFLPEYLFPANINEDWINNLHPRTAIGTKIGKDGKRKVVYAVIDGDKKNLGMGVTTLARYVKCEGWLAGILLDGGGSSELCVRSNIENHPSDTLPKRNRDGKMIDQHGKVVSKTDDAAKEHVERLLASGIVTIPKIPACPSSLQEACRLIIIKLVHDRMKEACEDRTKRMLSMSIFTQDFMEYTASLVELELRDEKGVDDRSIHCNWNGMKDLISHAAKNVVEPYILEQIDYSEFMDTLEWNKEVVFDNGSKGTLGAHVLKEIVFPTLGKDGARDIVEKFRKSKPPRTRIQCQEIQWFKEFYVCRKEISEIAGVTEKEKVRLAIEQVRDRFFYWLLKNMGVTDFSDKRAFCNALSRTISKKTHWKPLAGKMRGLFCAENEEE